MWTAATAPAERAAIRRLRDRASESPPPDTPLRARVPARPRSSPGTAQHRRHAPRHGPQSAGRLFPSIPRPLHLCPTARLPSRVVTLLAFYHVRAGSTRAAHDSSEILPPLVRRTYHLILTHGSHALPPRAYICQPSPFRRLARCKFLSKRKRPVGTSESVTPLQAYR